MPIYEYECSGCRQTHEVMQKITEQPLTECPQCGGKLRKKISNTSFVLKGTGWYATDYGSGSKGTASAKSKEKTSSSAPEKKAETGDVKKTETKGTPVSG